jgi:hypothetical protein
VGTTATDDIRTEDVDALLDTTEELELEALLAASAAFSSAAATFAESEW